MLIIGLILLTLSLGLWLLRRYLIQGRDNVRATYILDGIVRQIRLHFGSPYPALWGHQGTYAGRGDLCFRAYPAGYYRTLERVPAVQPDLICHELYHDVDRIRSGFVRFWSRILWELRKPYRDRPSEQAAIAAAPLILAGTCPGVDAAELLRRFA